MVWFRRFLLIGLLSPATVAAEGVVVVLTVDGAIGPATADYLSRGLQQAAEKRAVLTVVLLDTPGGLDTSMRDIIRDIIASPIPVVIYVSPSGARAASAGTYMLYAAHVAAMAPGTNLGAATPVAIGGLPDLGEPESPQAPKDEDKDDEKRPSGDKAEPAAPGLKGAMAKKAVNDAVAYIRSLAQMRGRNAEWAELAVREAASLSAKEALAKGVVDVIANDLPVLLEEIDGRTVNVVGMDRELATEGVIVEKVEPDWRNRLLAVITNPNIAYILMLLGVYGLFFELANPGFVLPGVIGGISLLLALYAFQVLPVNYAGVALILLGISFMVGEIFMPSFGVLGIGGIIAFVIGSVILFETDAEGYAVSIPLIGGIALASAAFFMGVIAMAVKFHRRPAVTGMDELIGSIGEAIQSFEARGQVRIHGERWDAECDSPLIQGQKVKVTAMQGLKLTVVPNREE